MPCQLLDDARNSLLRCNVLCTRAQIYKAMAENAKSVNFTEACMDLIETHKQLMQEIGILESKSRQAEKVILRIEDERKRAVLQLYYLCGFSMHEVADKLHYTVRWCYKIHKEAIDTIKTMPKEE